MKKLLSLLLAGALALSLVACGGSEPAPAPSEGGEPAATDTAKSPDNDIVVALQADTTSMEISRGYGCNIAVRMVVKKKEIGRGRFKVF